MLNGKGVYAQGVRVGDQSNQEQFAYSQSENQVLLRRILRKSCLTPFIFAFLGWICSFSIAQAAAISIPPIIAAPAGSPVISGLDQSTGCSLIPLGGYGVSSSGFTYTVVRFCDSNATEVQAFVKAGWGVYNNCTPFNSSYRHPADTCNASWPTLPGKAAECPTGYVLSSGMCNPTGAPVPDKNLGPESCVGNPINAGLGVKYQKELDLAPFSLVGVKFERNYNSLQGKYISNKFENKFWRHNYESQLVVKDWLGTPSTVLVARPNGKSYYFALAGGLWVADADIPDRLTELKDAGGVRTGWRYTVAADDSVEAYSATGKLLSIADRTGRLQTLNYTVPLASGGDDDPETLDTVTDDTGRQLRFAYDTSKRIATVTDPAGGLIIYGYDAQSNLTSVQYPDGKTKTYHYNEPAFTTGANLPHALTGITDENGARYATYQYAADGKAISTGHAAGADLHKLTYNPDGSTTVTDPPSSPSAPTPSKPSWASSKAPANRNPAAPAAAPHHPPPPMTPTATSLRVPTSTATNPATPMILPATSKPRASKASPPGLRAPLIW